MDVFTIARTIDEKGNTEYQIGGNTPPALALQMIFEAGMTIAKSEGERQALAATQTTAAKKKEEGAKKAAEAAKRKRGEKSGK